MLDVSSDALFLDSSPCSSMFDMVDPVRLFEVPYVGMSMLLCMDVHRRDREAHPRQSACDVQQRMTASAPELSLFAVVRFSKKRSC